MSFGMDLGLALMRLDDGEEFDPSAYLCVCGFDCRADPFHTEYCAHFRRSQETKLKE